MVPPESRGRRLVAIGVVAWTGVGIAGVVWLAVLALWQVAGVLPYLAVGGLVVLALDPLVRMLVRVGLPRGLAAPNG